jgi:hypothetical protein
MDPLTQAQQLLLEAHELCYATFGALVRDAGAVAVSAIRGESGLEVEPSPSASPGAEQETRPEQVVMATRPALALKIENGEAASSAAQASGHQRPQEQDLSCTEAAADRWPPPTVLNASTSAALLRAKFVELESALSKVLDDVSLNGLLRAFEERGIPAPEALQGASVMDWSLIEPIAAHLRQEHETVAVALSAAVERLAAQLGRARYGSALLGTGANRLG